MQLNNKGSILLYVLFLSSFLVLFFVSFQGEMEKILEGAKSSEKSIQDGSSIKDALTLLKNAPLSSKSIDSNGSLSLISLNQSGTVFSDSLGWNDSREYSITSTGGATSIILTVPPGGLISYHMAAFNSGSESSSVLIASGVAVISIPIPLSSSFDQHLLVLESLGGYVRYSLDISTSVTIPASSSYRLERDINGYKKDEGIYEVINFIPKLLEIDYQKMGMYLKK